MNGRLDPARLLDGSSGDHAPSGVRLDDETVERLARRVAELLRDPPASAPAASLVDAAAVAAALGCSRDWVYNHADRLGGMRLGEGPRPRLRFDLERAVEAAREARGACRASRRPDAPADPPAAPNPRHRRPARTGAGTELLPVRGGTLPGWTRAGRAAGDRDDQDQHDRGRGHPRG